MNSQLSVAVSQIHQQELRQAAREAQMAGRTERRHGRSRRFSVTLWAPRSVPVVAARVRAA
jgi:hypothetical protein